jgi:undecaprenyl-diphosphatase
MNKNIKLSLIFFTIFLIITIFISFIPNITNIDIKFLALSQKYLSFFPAELAQQFSSMEFWELNVCLFLIISFLFYKNNNALVISYFICYLLTKYNFTNLIKNIIQRPRPPMYLQSIIHPSSFSFPSGHCFNVTLMLGLIVYIIYKYTNKHKIKSIPICLYIIYIFWIIIIGLCRLKLGVHYITDVIAGYALALAILNIIIYIDKQKENKNEQN